MLTLEFIKTRSGHEIPVFEGKALHSTVNPIVEAEKLVQADLARLSRVASVIVLGLGGGFHIDELKKFVPGEIIVIESEKIMATELQKRNPALLEDVAVIAGESPSILIQEQAIIRALGGSFAFFKHPASVRQRSSYYKSVTEIFTRRTLSQLKSLTRSNSSLTSFFSSLALPENEPITLQIIEEAIQKRTSEIDETSKIWLTLRELVK